jgi:hypothetical protein
MYRRRLERIVNAARRYHSDTTREWINRNEAYNVRERLC